MWEIFLGRFPSVITAILIAVGLFGMLAKRNLIKKLIGMNILQTGIFLFFIQGSVQWGATIPVIDPELGIAAAEYVNPVPHVLILTAIVVGVATTGVALALVLNIYQRYKSLEEETILQRMKSSP